MKKLFYIILFLSFQLPNMYAQKTITLTTPIISKMLITGKNKVLLQTDEFGRITTIYKDSKEVCNVDYDKKEILLSDSQKKNHVFFREKRENVILFQDTRKEFLSSIYEIEDGMLKKYYYKNADLKTLNYYYTYQTEDNLIKISLHELMDYCDEKMDFADTSNIYQFSLQEITKLITKDEAVNDFNSEVLIYNGLESIIPFVLVKDFSGKPIIHYSATSELQEKKANYVAENLRFFDGLPWASAKGFGINDKILIELPRSNKLKLALYNGFQSDSRKDLYLANSRVKTLKITNLESNQSAIFDIKDISEKQILELEQLNLWYEIINHIEITIIDVYPGNKYEDLCIQAIIPEY